MGKYETIFFWSEEDNAYVVDVPELPGCMAHGESQEEALANAQQAIQLWLDTAKEFGDPIPVPRGRRLMYAWVAAHGECPTQRKKDGRGQPADCEFI
jgi:predicted RNase H-like HicB family nuclease